MTAYNRQSAYHWYLSSAFWKARREACLERAGYICERCKKQFATQVHHLTYLRVFNELPTDLAALCQDCHEEIHHLQPANDNQIQFRFSFPKDGDEAA